MYNKISTIMVIKIEVTRLIPLISEGGISNMLRQFRYEKMTTHKWNHSMIQANVLFVNIVKHYQEPRQDLPGCCLLKGWEAFGWNAPNFSRSNFLRYLRSERVSWRKNIVYVYTLGIQNPCERSFLKTPSEEGLTEKSLSAWSWGPKPCSGGFWLWWPLQEGLVTTNHDHRTYIYTKFTLKWIRSLQELCRLKFFPWSSWWFFLDTRSVNNNLINSPTFFLAFVPMSCDGSSQAGFDQWYVPPYPCFWCLGDWIWFICLEHIFFVWNYEIIWSPILWYRA